MLCPSCGKKDAYSERYDALYCAHCDQWLEGVCPDTICWARCADRPARPSQGTLGFNEPSERPAPTADPRHFFSRLGRLAYDTQAQAQPGPLRSTVWKNPGKN